MSIPDPVDARASVAPASGAAEPETAAGAVRAPRRARGHLRVDALLAAAAEVFASKGFDAATMTEIAAQSDSSIGSLYQFFRTKEAVAAALLQTQLDALWQRFDAIAAEAPGLSTTALAARLATFLVEFRRAHPSFATLVEMPGPPLPIVLGARRQVCARVEDVLARHAPAIDPARVRAMAPVVQHVMKAAVQLHAEFDGAARAAAAGELEAMLVGFLVSRLA